ncbi:MAG: glycoside hydrolase family 9 protein [Prolixibacteraceae bacterium]|nr:glycoside hydrolase family 9 protein [Prolixibacteraceae bacterium]
MRLINIFTCQQFVAKGNRFSRKIKTFVLLYFFILTGNAFAQELKINEQGYFEKQGLNVFVFSNEYNGLFFDEKTAGIELIHHGVRTSTGGAVRLQHTPEQWDLIPKVIDRKVDHRNNTIEVTLRYDEFDFDSRLLVTSSGNGVNISVYLDKPVPEALEGQAGFNMEFLPTAYFEKTWLADDKPGIFPKYPSGNTMIESDNKKIKQFAGHNTFDDRGRGEFIVPFKLASGKTFVLAPEDTERMVTVKSDSEIMLFDGRNLAQNGWFILRSILPVKKAGKVLEWYLEPGTIPNWVREPVIGFSQVGYTPWQEKVAVIELDIHDTPLKEASLFQVASTGEIIEKHKGEVVVWGKYFRYNYARFDFSKVDETGLYFIQYGKWKSNIFPISAEVYKNIWQPTFDVWFPVQMDHMEVNEAYRTWHGVPYLDDCLQAPLNHEHFDGYRQGPTTETKYKPLERIPGMAVGGWFDAGDFDIQTGSHNNVILSFVEAWENFGVNRDQTFIDQQTRYVDIHRPDGHPDILQQIEHGVLNLVAQVENIGHPVRGIVVPNLHQYHHLGDACTETDNLPYNPALKPYETDGKSSGTPDDRWAFTNRNAFLDYQTAASLAAASRALKGHNDELAEKSLAYAQKLFVEADEAIANYREDENNPWMRWARGSDMNAVLQLFISTKEEKYAGRFIEQVWQLLERPGSRGMKLALLALPYMGSEYKAKLRDYVIKYKDSIDVINDENPYGVPIASRGWGGTSLVTEWAITNYFAHKAFPDLIGSECIYKGLNYLYGCHPYSNVSFVNAVGVRTKQVAYGNNRADFTTIAGGVVPGLILLKPDYLENKDDWPFLWGENECVIGGGASYVVLGNAVNELINSVK